MITMTYKIKNKNKDIEIIKKSQMVIMKVKSTITEIKILLEGLNSRFELTERRISEFKDRLIESTQSE